MGNDEGRDDPFSGLKDALKRRTWGEATVLSIVATYADDGGNFEVAIVDEGSGQPVWEPTQCNVNNPDDELQAVMDAVLDFYGQWQASRADNFGEWKVNS